MQPKDVFKLFSLNEESDNGPLIPYLCSIYKKYVDDPRGSSSNVTKLPVHKKELWPHIKTKNQAVPVFN